MPSPVFCLQKPDRGQDATPMNLLDLSRNPIIRNLQSQAIVILDVETSNDDPAPSFRILAVAADRGMFLDWTPFETPVLVISFWRYPGMTVAESCLDPPLSVEDALFSSEL